MLRAVLDAGGDLKRRDHRHSTALDVARLMKREKLFATLSV
jgi:hypothetical protein